MDFLKELGRTNIKDLIQLIEWNEANNIRFMRLSSEMFPFASHGEYGYTLEYADKELKEAGDLVKKYGHRVTTHPGQVRSQSSQRSAFELTECFRSDSSHSLAVLVPLSSTMP